MESIEAEKSLDTVTGFRASDRVAFKGRKVIPNKGIIVPDATMEQKHSSLAGA